jgi:hypothetical protein
MFKHIKKYLKLLTSPVVAIVVIVFAAAIVYAAVSTSATGGGTITQFTTNWGDCKNIQNNNGQAFFVPANTQGEWDAFVNNAPNKILSSCCTENSGQACTSSANSCGQTNSGTYSCEGVCSASTPSNPAGYGDVCTSAANICGMANSGTIQCDGSCSAAQPADSSCPMMYQPNGNGGTINGPSGCHYEYECSNQSGYATSPLGQTCSTLGEIVNCYWTDSAAGCGGDGRVQGFFRIKESYTCSY